MTKRCAQCHAENLPAAAYCSQCGAKLAGQDARGGKSGEVASAAPQKPWSSLGDGLTMGDESFVLPLPANPKPLPPGSLLDEQPTIRDDSVSELKPELPEKKNSHTGSLLGEKPTLGEDSVSSSRSQLPEPTSKRAGNPLPDDSDSDVVDLELDPEVDVAPPLPHVGTRQTAFAPLQLDPQVDHLVEILPGGQLRDWPLTRPYYTIGRLGAKISVVDPYVSRRHISFARLGSDWVAIRFAQSKPMWVCGWNLWQKTVRRSDAFHIGKSWLVFVPGAHRTASPSLRPIAGRLTQESLAAARKHSPATHDATLDPPDDDEPQSHMTIEAGKTQLAVSHGEPLSIGSDPLCDICLPDPGLAPIDCLLAWMPGGPAVFQIAGKPLTDGKPMGQNKAYLRDGQKLTVGRQQLTIRVAGDRRIPAQRRKEEMQRAKRAVAVTILDGKHAGETVTLPTGKSVMVGRDGSCDLSLPRSSHLAAQQLEMTVSASSLGTTNESAAIQLRNLAAMNEIYINRVGIAGAETAHPGDVIQFGRSDKVAPPSVLLHYDLASESWPV